MKFPEVYNQARRFADADEYGTSRLWDAVKAGELMRKRGETGFVPSAFPKVNDIIRRSGLHVVTDVAGDSDSPSPWTNRITNVLHMPYPEAFHEPETYAHVLLHELAHNIGTKVNPSGHPAKSIEDVFGLSSGAFREEIHAELAAFLVERQLGLSADPTPRYHYIGVFLANMDEVGDTLERYQEAEVLAQETADAIAEWVKS